MDVSDAEVGGSIRELISGGGVDRPPVLLWKHFRTDEPRELARRTVAFYREHRLAAVKVMPDIPFLFEDQALSSWSQVAQMRRFGPIARVGRAAEYIRTVRLTRAQLQAGDVVLVTIFSPLGLVGLWCGQRGLRQMADGDRAVAHEVLWALAGLVSQLAEECVKAGADGVYYSCWGQDVLGGDEYRELGVPYDLAGLRGAAAAEFRLLHVHGALDAAVDRYACYPVQVVGWSEAESAIGLPEGAQRLPGKFVMGGISERRAEGALTADRARISQLRERLGTSFVVAPGCSLPDEISDEALAGLRGLVGQAPAGWGTG
jgi:uroporphyrinogen decarboxylase